MEKINIPCDVLEELYISKKLSSYTIADLLKVSRPTVLNYLNEYKISIRDTSQAIKIKWTKQKYRNALLKYAKLRWKLHSHPKGMLGKKPWNKGTKGLMKPNKGSFKKGKHYSPETEFKKGINPPTKFKPNDPRLIGKNNPRWRGGYEPFYGPDWREQRKKALERDKHICQICGSPETTYKHDVHHIKPYRESKDNSLSNLITLCRPCHLKIENGGKVKCMPFKEALNTYNISYFK